MIMGTSGLVGLGRNTITGMLSVCGRQFHDWTAACRLFSRERVNTGALFGVIHAGICEQLPEAAPFVALVDDTLLRKTGARIYGVSYRRDPLGPAFQTNLIRAQRFVQLSAAVPYAPGASEASVIPIDFVHAPTPAKPKKTALVEEWEGYRQKRRLSAMPLVAAGRIKLVRERLDQTPEGRKRMLWEVGDGGYSNGTTFKNLPERTVYIGRIRKDAKLYELPVCREPGGKGRKRVYGKQVPTPEEMRQDESIPWQTAKAWAAGREHSFRVKVAGPFRSRMAGARHLLRLVIISPLGYRLRKGGRLLYRKPAYLVCTEPELGVEKIVQAYAWRWGIEVNHRDEKQLIGVGQAQVRTPKAVEQAPALLVINYAMLLLAAFKTYRDAPIPNALPRPKWQKHLSPRRATTAQLIRQLRGELWGKALGIEDCSGFVNSKPHDLKPEKCLPSLQDAVLYA